MPGSATQQTIKDFVQMNYGDLPGWAQPQPADLKGASALGIPGWAQKPRTPSSFSQIGGGNQPLTAKQQAAQAKAQAAAQKSAAQQQAAATKAQAQQQKALAQQQKAASQQAAQTAQGAANIGFTAAGGAISLGDTVSSVGTGIADWAASWPTPGGIGLLLLVLFILLWALIPVDDQGYTRLQLLWFTVMGRTQLQGSTDQQNASLVATLADTTSPTLGVSSLAAAAQGTTQDFSVGVNTIAIPNYSNA